MRVISWKNSRILLIRVEFTSLAALKHKMQRVVAKKRVFRMYDNQGRAALDKPDVIWKHVRFASAVVLETASGNLILKRKNAHVQKVNTSNCYYSCDG